MHATPSLFDFPSPALPIAAPAPTLSESASEKSPSPALPRKRKTRQFEVDSLFESPLESTARPDPTIKKDPPLPRNFFFSSEDNPNEPEYFRVRRKTPYPPVLDDLLLGIVKSLPPSRNVATLCEGSIFPAVVGACSLHSEKIVYLQEDKLAKSIAKKMVGKNCTISFSLPKRPTSQFSLVVSCMDGLVGKLLADKIISLSNFLTPSGVLVVATPSEHLLDYATNVRNEAPLIRDVLHKKYRTHFILRPTGPLMHPSWDVLVLTLRPPASIVSKSKWRITGTGFLPWQKCNEAISSSPWLLVESLEQVPIAIARCVNYPWEAFDLGS